jgi:hypothetical protein
MFGRFADKKANVKMQMLFALFPVVNLWAAYRIKKLRKFLLLFMILSIGGNFLIGFFFLRHTIFSSF